MAGAGGSPRVCVMINCHGCQVQLLLCMASTYIHLRTAYIYQRVISTFKDNDNSGIADVQRMTNSVSTQRPLEVGLAPIVKNMTSDPDPDMT